MKNLLLVLSLFLLIYACSKDNNSEKDDTPELKYNHVIDENTNSHEIKIHSNKRVVSIKMSSNEYKSYVENEEFRESSGEKLCDLLKDVYKNLRMIMIL